LSFYFENQPEVSKSLILWQSAFYKQVPNCVSSEWLQR